MMSIFKRFFSLFHKIESKKDNSFEKLINNIEIKENTQNKYKLRILISGAAGSGKTTLAEEITKKLNVNNYALADKLKPLVHRICALFGIPENASKNILRPYYQKIGTECIMPTFGSDIWCKLLDEDTKHQNVVVISDVRFKHERKYFEERYKVYSIIVSRDGNLNGTQSMHSSEQEYKEMTYNYEYDGTLRSKNILIEILKEEIKKLYPPLYTPVARKMSNIQCLKQFE